MSKLENILKEFRKQHWFQAHDYENLEIKINAMMLKSGSMYRYKVCGSDGSLQLLLEQSVYVPIGELSLEQIQIVYGINYKRFKNETACFKISPNDLKQATGTYDGIIISVCPLSEWKSPTHNIGTNMITILTLENFNNFYLAIKGNVFD